MDTLDFSNTSFVLYQILPDDKKIDFLNQAFDGNVVKTSQRFYEQHFKSVIAPSGETEIGIISYVTPDGAKINIFFHDDYMHVNSNKLVPIKELVGSAFMDGHILVLDKTLKKTKDNRERFHMRFYRAYKKLNDPSRPFPLSQN